MATKFAVSTIFKGIDKMSAPIRKISNRLDSMTRRASKNLNRLQRQTNRLTGGMTSLAKTGAASGTALAVSIGTALRAGVDFEHTMTTAAAKMGSGLDRTSDQFGRLEQKARQVGATTQFTATDAAKGIEALAMAGFNAEQSIAAIDSTARLAVISNIDLAEATEFAAKSLGSLNLRTKDSVQLGKNLTSVVDLYAAVATNSATNTEAMFEALRLGAPAARAAGASIEEVGALIGIFANAGIEGTVAGTGLKNIFVGMAKPGSEAAAVLRRLGVETMDAEGNTRSVISVFKDLAKGMDGLGSAQRLAVLETLFGKIPLAQATNLINAAGGELDDMVDIMNNASGSAERMASSISDTTLGSIRSLISVIESVSIRTFALSKGPLRDVIDDMTEWVRANGDLMAQRFAQFLVKIATNFDEIVETGVKIAKVVAVLWAAEKAITAMVGVMTLARGAALLFNAALLANPLVWIPAAVIAIGALATAIYQNWEPIKAFFSDLWGGVKEMFFNAIDAISAKLFGWIDKVKAGFKAVADAISFGPVEGGNLVVQTGAGGNAFAVAGQRGFVPQNITPEERAATLTQETTNTQKAELVIKDETGRAELKGGKTMNNLKIEKTGEFE